jgi:hypothetical protein
MYVESNIEVQSCNSCSRGRAMSITYSECVFVAFGTKSEMRMRHCHVWPVRLYNIFPHYLINGTT